MKRLFINIIPGGGIFQEAGRIYFLYAKKISAFSMTPPSRKWVVADVTGRSSES
jgi:hypothetical protein